MLLSNPVGDRLASGETVAAALLDGPLHLELNLPVLREQLAEPAELLSLRLGALHCRILV
jgi:hypothetical protein